MLDNQKHQFRLMMYSIISLIYQNLKLKIDLYFMKQAILFFLTLSTTNLFSQKASTSSPLKTSPYTLQICTDQATNKQIVKGSKPLICSKGGKKSFQIDISWKMKNNVINYNGLIVKSSNMGACMEKDELLFLFSDNTSFALKAWNEPNCDGISLFDLEGTENKKYSDKKLVSIRLQNGRTFESLSYQPSGDQKNYFRNAANAVQNKLIENVKCK
jgi:hypothetical protein